MGSASKVVTKEDIILFDGVCNLCNGAINFVIDRDHAGHFKFASLQSDFAKTILNEKAHKSSVDSIVLIKDDMIYHKSDAALEIAGELKGGWRVLKLFKVLPRGLRDAVYDLIARNRYKWFGKRDTCRLPTPDIKERFLDSEDVS